jgi:hypothetical protein
MTAGSLSRDFSTEKARCHFEVIKRFTETFAYDELFPDVAWDKIVPQRRQLHAKCLIAATYLTIGQSYIKTNGGLYAQTAFDLAHLELRDCLKMDPNNQLALQLMQKTIFLQTEYNPVEPPSRLLAAVKT